MGMQHENEYNDKLRLSKSQSFADVRLQEYIIRKRGTSEFEKKFNHQMDEIKTRLSHNKLTDVDEIDCNEEDVDYQEGKKNNVKNEEGNETKTLSEDLNDNVSISTDVNTLHFMDNIKKSEDRISSDEATDTSKIEQAVGLIEVNHNKPNEENQCIKDLLSMQLEKDTSENQEKKKTHSPQKKKKKKKKKKENETKKKEPANKLKTKTS